MAVWDGVLDEQDKLVAELSGYGRRGGFGERPVVLVIDVTINFCGDHPQPVIDSVHRWRNSCGQVAWDAVEPTKELLDVAHSREIPVIYSAGTDTPDQAVYSGRWADKNRRRAEDLCSERVDGNQIIAPLAPLTGDMVIRKTKPSVFFGTPLLSYLVDLQVDTIICCGATTSGCVRATVLDGFSHNYRLAVVEECTFDRTSISHKVNLFDMHQKYADVTPLADVLTYLNTRSSGLFRDQLAPLGKPAGQRGERLPSDR